MSYSVITNPEIITEEKSKLMSKEITDFLKFVEGNPERLFAVCHIQYIDGHSIQPAFCSKIEPQLLKTITEDFCALVLSGKMKVTGKINNWSCGFLGSRWCDMDAKKYGLTYIRAIFTSRKYKPGYDEEKPYTIRLMIEKERTEDSSDEEETVQQQKKNSTE